MCFTVNITDDSYVENSEMFRVELTASANVFINPMTTMISIISNDSKLTPLCIIMQNFSSCIPSVDVTVEFQLLHYTVPENSTTNICASITFGVSKIPLLVNVIVDQGTAEG